MIILIRSGAESWGLPPPRPPGWGGLPPPNLPSSAGGLGGGSPPIRGVWGAGAPQDSAPIPFHTGDTCSHPGQGCRETFCTRRIQTVLKPYQNLIKPLIETLFELNAQLKPYSNLIKTILHPIRWSSPVHAWLGPEGSAPGGPACLRCGPVRTRASRGLASSGRDLGLSA